jgi:hypothetical protein
MAKAGTTAGTGRSEPELLGIYLNDHLAGATGGAELARRVAGSHKGNPGGALQRLAAEVRQDRAGRLDELISRARRQADLLEELRVRAAEHVIGREPGNR